MFPLSGHRCFLSFQNAMPNVPVHSLIERLYPYETILGKEGVTAVEDTLSVSLLKQHLKNIQRKIAAWPNSIYLNRIMSP